MTSGDDVDVVVSGEQLLVGTEWVVAGTVRVRRRVVTERRTIAVDVRREIVEVEGETVDFRDGRLVGTALGGPRVAAPAPPGAPFVTVLREEVPRVVLDVRDHERLTVTTTLAAGTVTVADTLGHEVIETTWEPMG